jgi:cytochrome c oxidase subunit 2
MSNLLILGVIVLGVVLLAQVTRVYELTSKLTGRKEYEVSDSENRTHANLWVIYLIAFFAFFIWLWVRYGDNLLTISGSEHGDAVDTLLWFNFAVIIMVFVITHILLVAFVYLYKGRKNGKADFITHNNKLELIWTTTPAIVLAVIIIYGISTWNSITSEPENPVNIELYAKQFDWTARYAGEDNKLGAFNFRMTSANNPLGVITDSKIEERLTEMKQEIADLEESRSKVFPGGKTDEEILDKIASKKKHMNKVLEYQKLSKEAPYVEGNDDKLVKTEFHIPVNQPVRFQIRAQDVIHSAYMPHFRAQMNAVPGMVTTFSFVPTKTTAEMRDLLSNPEFDYLLYCNKICGAAHYNMQMKIIVESESDYKAWLAEQPSFVPVDELKEASAQNIEEETKVIALK